MDKQKFLFDINNWQNELGLMGVPMFGTRSQENRFVLLNGLQGNFCLDVSKNTDDNNRDLAWSANVGHYVTIHENYLEVQRWDQKKASFERYSCESVYNKLEEFHRYLESNTPSHAISIISHVIHVFRSLRSELGKDFNGSQSLKAFLYFLACANCSIDRNSLLLNDWGLSNEAKEIALHLSESKWELLLGELMQGRVVDGLRPNLTLLQRHAAGQLFQEAHYEAIFFPHDQLSLFETLNTPINIRRTSTNIGLHFTPPALARTLVEECFSLIDIKELLEISIFDPACGSGEFLREALRQLELRKYPGEIKLIGWDISEAACDMARFVVTWEKRHLNNRISLDIRCVDSLNPDLRWPSTDIILMNPPFMSWQNLSIDGQQNLRRILGGIIKGRPDLSFAFTWLAANSLKHGGVMGSIIPASFLDGESAISLRERIGEILSSHLIARLGSQQLFPNAIVDAALYIGIRKDNLSSTLVFWADHKLRSNSAGLRALRKLRNINPQHVSPIIGEGFCIYENPSIRRSNNWAPRPYHTWHLLQELLMSNMPSVKDLFDVKQGVRTGLNSAFILSKFNLEKLPKKEQEYFRPAILNETIQDGYLNKSAYVFFPYDDYNISNERELKKLLSFYYKQYLLPNKTKLKERKGINEEKWWSLTRYREWQIKKSPKLISTYFGKVGSFAWDQTGDFIVVQGHAWLYRSSSKFPCLPENGALAYLTLLNSSFFEGLLSAVSNHVGGGQWNLSAKFVSSIPLPNLLKQEISPSFIKELATYGKFIHEGKFSLNDNKKINSLIEELYQVHS